MAEWDRVLSVNLRGTMLCLHYEIPHMLAHGSGAIVNNASVAGLIGTPNSPAYTTSKHGIIGLTRSTALDYAKKNLRVNAVCPGVIHTPQADRYMAEDPAAKAQLEAQSPMGRMGRAEDISAARPVDGGWTAGTWAEEE